MKKFLKTLFVLLVILAVCITVYYFKNEIYKKAEDVYFLIDDNLISNLKNEPKENEIYSQAEIQAIINETNSNKIGDFTGKIDNYYYNQLNTEARIIYRVFKDNLETMKQGTYNIKLPSILENTLELENGQEKINQDFQDAWDALKLDIPEIFYIDVSKMCLMTKTITRGTRVKYELCIQNQEDKSSLPSYFNSKEDVDIAINKIESIKKEIISNVQENDFAKVIYIHNWIIDNLKYDISTTKVNNNNIYGGMVKKEVVCEGYAKTFKYLLDELGIPCVTVCGTGIDENGKSEKHAWNYVYMQGNWYAIDTTWDDPIIIGNGTINNSIRYKYFLKGADEFSKNHIENGKFTENGLKFEYPILNRIDYRNNLETL